MLIENITSQEPESLGWEFPLPRTHCGIPLGNGLFGALVWGGKGRLCVTLNRADFWDHRAGELTPGVTYQEVVGLYDSKDPRKMDEPFEVVGALRPAGAFRNTRLPMGRFELHWRQGWSLTRARLWFKRGELRVELGTKTGECRELRLALHPTHPVLVLEGADGLLEEIRAHAAWEWVGEALQSRGYVAPVPVVEGGIRGWIQQTPEDGAMAALCEDAGNGVILMAMAGGGDPPAARAAAGIELGHGSQPAMFFRQTAEWWESYWRDLPEVALPDPKMQSLLNLSLWKFAAATSPQSSRPSGLQGPWCEEYQMPPWSADYHLNVNVQEIYALAFPTGKMTHLHPLFAMIERCLPLFQEQARRVMGVAGGVLITHTIDDRGMACGGVGPAGSLDQACAGWLAQLYWQYYQFTGDREFLRTQAMPLLAGVLRTYEAMLDWSSGTPRLPISVSAEYYVLAGDGERQRLGPNASYQLACIHMLTNALLEGAADLGMEPEASWLKLNEAVPPWTLAGLPGEERIAIWEGQDLEVSHRHHSHLAAIYPFDIVRFRSSEEQEIIDRSLQHWLKIGPEDWSEWCLSWAAIIQAREGYRESPLQMLELFQKVFVNESGAAVYQPRMVETTSHGLPRLTGPLETCEIMQLDGSMGFATAIYEMLAHEHAGVVRLCPAVPQAWREISFSGVHLPGGLLAGASIRDGKVGEITLEARRGRELRLEVAGWKTARFLKDGEWTILALPGTLKLQAGERLTAVAGEENTLAGRGRDGILEKESAGV